MTRQKDLKRLIRARMNKTGESYTAARAHVLKKSEARAEPGVDFARLAGMSDAVVQEKTGRAWNEWVSLLDARNAQQLPHRDLATLVHEQGAGDWWSQMVAVGYERIKGMRARGQRRDGSYEATKSRTYPVPVNILFDAWADASQRRRWLDASGVKVRAATSPKSIRLGWADGSIIAVGFFARGDDKASVALSHTKVPDKETATRLKAYWSEQLDALGRLLETRQTR